MGLSFLVFAASANSRPKDLPCASMAGVSGPMGGTKWDVGTRNGKHFQGLAKKDATMGVTNASMAAATSRPGKTHIM